jgi:mannose-6-phosphate isomerase-like protein (cupin superfamily)
MVAAGGTRALDYETREAVLMDDAAGTTHRIEPGTLWVARKGTRFRFRAETPTRLICVFSPPFAGRETGFAGDQ